MFPREDMETLVESLEAVSKKLTEWYDEALLARGGPLRRIQPGEITMREAKGRRATMDQRIKLVTTAQRKLVTAAWALRELRSFEATAEDPGFSIPSVGGLMVGDEQRPLHALRAPARMTRATADVDASS